jgi:hypothetical protein
MMTVEYLLRLAEEKNINFKAHPDRLPDLFNSCRTLIGKVQLKLKQLNAKRSRILAHSDPTIVYNPDKIAKATEVTFSDLDLLFSATGRILNEMSEAYNGVSSDFEVLDVDDYKTIIQLVADAKHEMVESYEREFGVHPPFSRPKTARKQWFQSRKS